MTEPLNISEMLISQARVQPHRIGIRDLERELSFADWNTRACRLANNLIALGLKPGERIAVIAHNRIEWAEIYVAVAKAGLVAVPINFRLSGPEVLFICQDCSVSAIIAEDPFVDLVDAIRDPLAELTPTFISMGALSRPYWTEYEHLVEAGPSNEPAVNVSAEQSWCLMYTSGTTGNPKGAIRNHHSAALISIMTCVELGFSRNDHGLLVMPMCHANSLYFFVSLLSIGATSTIFSVRSFDPVHCLETISQIGISFTSLTPTHYMMLLDIPEDIRQSADLSKVQRLMISSATARVETKKAVMQMFPNSGLFELYGSTEAAWVTMLHPEEQFDHLGTVGREVIGSAAIKLLDDMGNEVPDGTPGELYSCSPYNFSGYWNLPEKTQEAFNGDYLSVGDIAVRDEAGFIRLIDRKKNMIITGGENVYPTEVEAMLGAHPDIKDVAVVGCAHPKWGEEVTAAVVLQDQAVINEAELLAWTKGKIAGFKRPRRIVFLKSDEMPRNTTGKIMHRILRERLSKPSHS